MHAEHSSHSPPRRAILQFLFMLLMRILSNPNVLFSSVPLHVFVLCPSAWSLNWYFYWSSACERQQWLQADSYFSAVDSSCIDRCSTIINQSLAGLADECLYIWVATFLSAVNLFLSLINYSATLCSCTINACVFKSLICKFPTSEKESIRVIFHLHQAKNFQCEMCILSICVGGLRQ